MDRTPVGAKLSAPSSYRPWDPSTLLYNGYWLSIGIKAAGAWYWPPQLLLVPGYKLAWDAFPCSVCACIGLSFVETHFLPDGEDRQNIISEWIMVKTIWITQSWSEWTEEGSRNFSCLFRAVLEMCKSFYFLRRMKHTDWGCLRTR